MYVQYKVNVSENQLDTLKDAIRQKKAPHPRFVGDGLFLKHRNYISDGAGLLMGKNSPVLGWLL